MQNILAKLKLFWQKPSTKWLAAILVTIYVIYSAVSFFSLPRIIQNQAQQFVNEKFNRNIKIQSVSFNPLTLTAEIDGLDLSEPGKTDSFVSFDHLVVDLSTESIFRLAPVIEEVRLVNPKVHLVRTEDNHYNIDDFIAFALKPSEDDSPTRFSVNNIQIENAQIVFDNQPLKQQYVVDQFNLTIPFISNIPSKVETFVDLDLNGRFNGEPIALSGQARPFFKDQDGNFNLHLKDIHLPKYMGYLPFKPNFIMRNGLLSIDLQMGFEKPESGSMQLGIAGKVGLNDLILAQTDGREVVRLPQLTVDIAQSSVLQKAFAIDRIALERPQVNLARNKAGRWNLQEMSKITAVAANKTEDATTDSADAKNDSALKVDLGAFEIHDGLIQVQDQLQVVPTNFKMSQFDLKVEGAHLDMATRTATIDQISSNSTNISFIHGLLNKQKQMKVAGGSGGEPFNFSIGKVALKDWNINCENKYKGQSWKFQLEKMNVTVDNITSDFSKAMALQFDASVNRRGHMNVKGNVAVSPLKADLDLNLNRVDVRAVQPYIEEFVNLSVKRADFSAKGKMQLALGAKGAVTGRFTGNAALSDLVTVDQLTKRPFVNWKDLSFNGVNLNLSPMNINVNSVALNGVVARVILNKDAHLNVQDILRSSAGGQRSLTESSERVKAEPKEAVEEEAAPVAKSAPNYKIEIGKWAINNGRIQFSDNFIRPHYTANLLNLNGSITGLSTDASKQAGVNIRGRVNGAPLSIAGTVNPLSQELALDIAAKVKGMELAQFSSYSGKYIGYGIEKGKLSFDVAYKIKDRQLTAENQLILDQLTLGEKVESETATSLPVTLALALLKDRHGVIDINLPVGGSLDDPEFSVGGVIVRMFVNLITKAVTSPFALLSSIVGDGEELSFVVFNPGTDVMPATEVKKLESLAKALQERPGLSLEITGTYDPAVDGPGLAKHMIQRKAREAKRRQTGAVDKVEISEAEYAESVKQVYKSSNFEKPAYWFGMNKSLPQAEMEKLIGKNYSPSVEEYQRLTTKRAEVAKNWLLEHGIPEERLFILAGKKSQAPSGSGNRVDFSLH